MNIQLYSTRLGLLNSKTRIPFRYGIACMTHCPQAVLEVIVNVDGRRVNGYSGDCLPPLWFDKTPGKSFEQQIDEMQLVIRKAADACADEFHSPQPFVSGWQAVYDEVHELALLDSLPELLASFGVSMLERALVDAVLRACGRSFYQGVRDNIFEMNFPGPQPREFLPSAPRQKVFVRHTVGLGDPLTRAELKSDDDPADGFPVTLEEHLQNYGIQYLKIKVSNQLERDVDRLRAIAALVEKFRGHQYSVTLDGNEQYHEVDQLDQLIAALENDSALCTLWANTLVVEQPLPRAIALDERHAPKIRDLCARKPLIIDESDGGFRSFEKAIALGYRGVSTKSCKGPIKSLKNLAQIWQHNRSSESPLIMTAEDLCTVGVIPLQADLCLVATLGLEHVERNGHHYHPGLSYLPEKEREDALALHGDLYYRHADRIAPRIVDGQFEIRSLQCPGFGFAALPDMSQREIVWEVSR